MADDKASDGIGDIPYAQAHSLYQYKFQGHYLTTMNAGSLVPQLVRLFICSTLKPTNGSRGGDPKGDYKNEKARSRHMFELWGHLFADGFNNDPNNSTLNQKRQWPFSL